MALSLMLQPDMIRSHMYLRAVLTSLFLCLLLLVPCAAAFEPPHSPSSPPSSVATPTPPASTRYPPHRTLVPAFPSLHVLFVVGTGTWTHVAAPIEYMLELKRRGHRITWQQPHFLVRWFNSEAERLTLPFNFSLVDVDESDSLDAVVRLMSERPWIDVFDEVVRHSHEPMYPTLYRATLAAVEQDRPDLVVCDSIADHCFDVARKLHLPAVITHCTTPFDGNAPWQYDVPSSFTPWQPYSQRWHEQSLWSRLYNTFGVLPHVLWNGGVRLSMRIDALKEALGSPGRLARTTTQQGMDVLYDSSWAWEWPLYWPPYLHMVGPIPKTWRATSQQLPTAQQHWLDESATAGVPVVYVAMGSLATLTDQWQRAFATCFSSCPAVPVGEAVTNDTSLFRVLWAHRGSPQWLKELLPPSVHLEQWVNQPAVLAHPAVHLFLSHSGMGSAHEAISVGLPILALPLLIDQPPIAAKLRDRGVAEVLDKMTFTADDMCGAMRRLVFEPHVRRAVDTLQRLYHKSDGGGLQRAVDIIERAAVSTEHLIPYREREDVSWVVRYNVDVYLIGAVVLASVLGALGALLWQILQRSLRLLSVRRTKSKMS